MAKSNPRYDCSNPNCKARNTRNQLRGSNGICIHCKTPMNHTSWMGGQMATLAQLLTIPKEDEKELDMVAEKAGCKPADLILAAISEKLRCWLSDPDNVEAAAKQDLMLAKLYRR